MAVSTEEIIQLATGGSDLPVPAEAKRIRRAAGVSQLELARTLGVHEQTVSGWETGEFEPAGENRARYRLFLQHAALTQRTRRKKTMSSVLGFSQPINPDPPTVTCGNTIIEEQDLTALLHALKFAGDEGITVVVGERNIRRYGDPTEALYDRAVYLEHRGLVDKTPHDEWENGNIVQASVKFVITPAGLAAIGEVGSA